MNDPTPSRRRLRRLSGSYLLGGAACIAALPAGAQMRLDRADPSVAARALPAPAAPAAATPPAIAAPPAVRAQPPAPRRPRIARTITVSGASDLAAPAFDPVVAPFVGRDLSAEDLTALASATAAQVRQAGYPLATASVTPQDMADGALTVTVDEGRIDAVRVLGASHPLADRMLGDALANGRPVRRDALERALALVGDLPGVTVRETRYIRQDGFGILLVTIDQDRASAYLQLDNRGSEEVGPIRSTLLGSVRNVLQSGDEIGILASNTPFQPSEFGFIRARYGAPVDLGGSTLTVSASYGRAHPGGPLKPLDVIGHSYDAGIAYSRPLLRGRERSLWAGLEWRGLKSDQTLLGRMLRDDRLSTLTASLNGTAALGGGSLRGEAAMTGGLPLDGVTHAGDPLASRGDGDARFLAWSYSVDWVRPLGHGFGLALASAGQLASRPLLASAEIGLGGPAFGRGYDYAERTGDQGVLGSAELRADAGRIIPGMIDRLQLYGFIDGGYVDNLRGGFGGGALASAGTGARLGHGPLDGMIELAVPVTADRLTSGDRSPRVFFRLSRLF